MVDSNYYAGDTETGESKPFNKRYVKYSEIGLSTDSTCNTLWSWGWNCEGELMLNNGGTMCQIYCPTQEITSSLTWCHTSMHRCHNTAIKNDGTLWASGIGFNGILGDGTTVCRSSPVQEFCSDTTWCTTSQNGWFTTHAIKTDGTLWSWGSGTTGELAMGTLGAPIGTLSCSPIQEYTSSTNWCYVLRTDYSSHAIKSDNTLWGWGCNDDGNLAIGTSGVNNCYSSPIQEYTSSSWSGVNGWGKVINALKTNGSIWSWGTGCGLYFGIGECVIVSFSSPVREMCSATNWCCVSSTLYGAYALKTDGTLWGWGRYTPSGIDSCSPVQEVNSHTNWCLVDGGIVHGGGIKTDGTLWSWGSIAGTAALGDGTNNSCSIPTQEYYSATNWYKYSGGTYTGTGLRIV